jgi:hypothetical protein
MSGHAGSITSPNQDGVRLEVAANRTRQPPQTLLPEPQYQPDQTPPLNLYIPQTSFAPTMKEAVVV